MKKKSFWWRATKWVVRNLYVGSKWLVIGIVSLTIYYIIKTIKMGA